MILFSGADVGMGVLPLTVEARPDWARFDKLEKAAPEKTAQREKSFDQGVIGET